jgi:hypothetical protein
MTIPSYFQVYMQSQRIVVYSLSKHLDFGRTRQNSNEAAEVVTTASNVSRID